MNFYMRSPMGAAAAPLPAAQVLGQLGHVEFKNAEDGRRHPAALYTMAIRTVVDAFEDALAAYDAVVQSRQGEHLDDALRKSLVRATDHLLDAVAEHFDDAKACLQLVLGDLAEKDISKHLRQYGDDIREVRAFCTTQVNEMKHRQGRLQLIHMTFADVTVWGYFVQGVGKHGEIGPSRVVHKTNTAYSFGRAFRMLVTAVLFTSKALATALHRSPTFRLAQGAGGFGSLLPLIERLAAWPRVVFWDETQCCPDLQVSEYGVEVRVPAQRRWKRPPHDTRIRLVLAMEEHTSAYGLPYMGDWHRGSSRQQTRQRQHREATAKLRKP